MTIKSYLLPRMAVLTHWFLCRNAQYTSLASIVQASYAQDWIKANMGRSATAAPAYIPPGETLASSGHATAMMHASRGRNESLDNFRMPRFQNVGPRTNTYRRSGGAADNYEQQEEYSWLSNSINLVPTQR